MPTGIFIQARMRSTRLPGKVFKAVLNKPLLAYLVERLQRVKRANTLSVLTTKDPSDDIIEGFCHQYGIRCYRGSSENVLDRYFQAMISENSESIVRITGDCPLMDPEIVDELIAVFQEGNWDYVSNTLQRSYPRGMDVEIFSRQALIKAKECAQTLWETEHVTPYIYGHPEEFKLKNVLFKKGNFSHLRLTVDTQEDFELIDKLITHLYPSSPQFSLEDILSLLEVHPEWAQINAHVSQKTE